MFYAIFSIVFLFHHTHCIYSVDFIKFRISSLPKTCVALLWRWHAIFCIRIYAHVITLYYTIWYLKMTSKFMRIHKNEMIHIYFYVQKGRPSHHHEINNTSNAHSLRIEFTMHMQALPAERIDMQRLQIAFNFKIFFPLTIHKRRATSTEGRRELNKTSRNWLEAINVGVVSDDAWYCGGVTAKRSPLMQT